MANDAGVPQIPPIAPPTPPPAPAAPRAPNAPIVNVTDFARTLVQMLPGKRDEVLATVDKLSAPDRDALEKAIVGILTKDNKEQAYLLRRIIRFVRHKPSASPKGDAFTVSSEGTQAGAEIRLPVRGVVTIRTGVEFKTATDKWGGGYSITYKGSDAAEMRWLQFIWRAVRRDSSVGGGTWVKMRLDHQSGPYYLTTNEKMPRWTTDSSSPTSAFYEERNFVKRYINELTMFDSPSAVAYSQMTAGLQPNQTVQSLFRANTYLIHGMDVLYCAEIGYSWSVDSQHKAWVVTAGGRVEDKLKPEQRARLLIQYPNVDYLPGPPIGAPEPIDEFDPIPDLDATDWDKPKSNVSRYSEIAELAAADLILDVTGTGEASISDIGQKRPGGSDIMKVSAGLNFDDKLPVEGETGYIDAKGEYHNPDFPIDHDGPLPRVAIKLGPKAFIGVNKKVRDKAFALATMRHEMMHAAHEQLAIGWALKWRDEITARSFANWVEDEKIPVVTKALIKTGITTPVNRLATEVLAWTEGFVTALPFLPPTVEFDQIKTDVAFPGAISELRGAGEFLNQPNLDNEVKDAVRERIRRAVCPLPKPEREALKEWLNKLIDPSSLQAKTPSEKSAVDLITSSFRPLTDFLKQIRDIEKACPTSP